MPYFNDLEDYPFQIRSEVVMSIVHRFRQGFIDPGRGAPSGSIDRCHPLVEFKMGDSYAWEIIALVDNILEQEPRSHFTPGIVTHFLL